MLRKFGLWRDASSDRLVNDQPPRNRNSNESALKNSESGGTQKSTRTTTVADSNGRESSEPVSPAKERVSKKIFVRKNNFKKIKFFS